MTSSAGLLLHRSTDAGVEVLIVHPGGPFWARKDEGAWSIPKGEYDPDTEEAHEAAIREFAEELGSAPTGDGSSDVDLGEVVQAAGKRVRCFARAADHDTSTLASNTFEVAWPPRSGRTQTFPEVDRAEWSTLELARTRLNAAQVAFLDRLVDHLGSPAPGPTIER